MRDIAELSVDRVLDLPLAHSNKIYNRKPWPDYTLSAAHTVTRHTAPRLGSSPTQFPTDNFTFF